MDLVIRQDSRQAGQTLMDIDRGLMEAAARSETGIVIRFYEWEVPTVSLGYHQSDTVLDHQRLFVEGTPFVHRPTGGAAVLHSDELTYAVVIPNADAPGMTSWVQENASEALALGLRSVGVDARVDSRGEPLSALSNRASCFVRTSRWEVTARGKKIVGSAQRKWESAILQHGSILLGDDHVRIADYLTLSSDEDHAKLKLRLHDHSTCIEAELGHRISVADLRAAMENSFRTVFSRHYSTISRDLEV